MSIPTSQRINEYRQRANEVRLIAHGISDREAANLLREMAEKYERMADLLEARGDSQSRAD